MENREWSLVIRGVGPINNSLQEGQSVGGNEIEPKGVDAMARKFVKELEAAGHEVNIAVADPGHLVVSKTDAEKNEATKAKK